MTTTQTLPNGITVSTKNILSVLHGATKEDMAFGARWYDDANTLCRSLASEHGRTLEAVIGAVAALSPRTHWGRNVMLATACARDGEITSGTMSANMNAANKIMSGMEPLEVLKGIKVRAFYWAILNPSDQNIVVGDAHAISVAAGRTLSPQEQSVLKTVGVYDTIANLYREVAESKRITPAQVQSITWVAWRNIGKRFRTI
jgi:hypothetical protein